MKQLLLVMCTVLNDADWIKEVFKLDFSVQSFTFIHITHAPHKANYPTIRILKIDSGEKKREEKNDQLMSNNGLSTTQV